MKASHEDTKARRKLVPKLRFPEFQGDGGWEELSLSDVSKVQNKKIPVQKLSITDYISTENLLPDFTGVTCASNLPNVNSVTEFLPDDILLANIRPYLKKAWSATRKGGASNDVIVFRSRDNVKQKFLSIRIRSDAFIDHVMSGAKGVKMPRGDVAQMKTFPFPLPESAEQQKIADCLGSLDDLIAAHSAKLDALQDHKKGLLQKLFPAEGQTTPELRFPGFEGEWEEKPLKKIADYQNGKAYEKHIVDEGTYIVVNSRFVSTEGSVKKYTNEEFCPAKIGDVLMVLSDLPKGRALAKCFFVEENNRFGVNQRVSRLRAKGIHNKFFYYRMNRHASLLAYDDGITQTHLSKSDVEDCLLMVPNSLDEQQKIADCLSALDDQIAAQTDQIAALKQHKQGLMQQLFPNSDLIDA
jgi:type I restriction enzyme S subunit